MEREIQITDQDPYWLPEDTAAELEWVSYEATLCSGCGHSKLQSMDSDNEGAYDTVGFRCWSCEDRDRTAHEASKADKTGAGRYGMYYATRLRGELDDDGDS